MSLAVRFGLIGYGLWGRHHATALASAPGATLVAIACASESTAAVAARDFPSVPVDIGYRALLARPDIDAVAVVVPNHLHAEVGVAALEAGKDVLLEKPMATTVEDCDRLIAAARTSGRVLTIGHELRLSAQYGRVKEMIDAGQIGVPQYIGFSLFRFPGGAHAVITETLAGFEYHQTLHVAGTEGAIRSWWSGTLDRTLHPTFELRRESRGKGVETVPVEHSGELVELRVQAREVVGAFTRRRALVSGEEARKRIVVCLAAEQSLREGREIALRF